MNPESGIESAVESIEGADRIRTGVSPLSLVSAANPLHRKFGQEEARLDAAEPPNGGGA